MSEEIEQTGQAQIEQEPEDKLLRGVLGMLNDNVRIYQMVDRQEVTRDEFAYCQVMYDVLFGDTGFAKTLGPTWNMIHDPRFRVIEGMMVVERKAIFGGDARMGKQYFSPDGVMNSAVSDLEKYSEILGEGRNFHNVCMHPDPACQERLWLERIYRGFTNIKPYAGFGCTCTDSNGQHRKDPVTIKIAPDDVVWALIKQECPNRAFTQGGSPTAYGNLMFNLIRADLVGLIHDYCETPLIDSYVYLRDHGVVTATESVAFIDPHGQEAPRVLQEIDILEQALTHRSTMRVTAYKLLRKLGIESKFREMTGKDFVELTDLERDEVLRLVYDGDDYPEQHPELTFRMRLHEWEKQVEKRLLAYLADCAVWDFEERQHLQLASEKAEALSVIRGLKSGEIQSINHYTEPVMEIPEDTSENDVMKYSAMMEAIMSNEFKQELYLLMVEAERQGATAIIDILTPVFLTPDYPLDETGFYNILESIRIGSRSLRVDRLDAIRGTKQTSQKKGIVETEGEFHSRDNPEGVFK